MNPMMQMLNQNNIKTVRGMMDMVRMASNPQAALGQIAAQNPQMQQVMQVIQQNGGDPRAAFYKVAKERGIDPDSVLSQLR